METVAFQEAAVSCFPDTLLAQPVAASETRRIYAPDRVQVVSLLRVRSVVNVAHQFEPAHKLALHFQRLTSAHGCCVQPVGDTRRRSRPVPAGGATLLRHGLGLPRVPRRGVLHVLGAARVVPDYLRAVALIGQGSLLALGIMPFRRT